jgi:hypothetical protein
VFRLIDSFCFIQREVVGQFPGCLSFARKSQLRNKKAKRVVTAIHRGTLTAAIAHPG